MRIPTENLLIYCILSKKQYLVTAVNSNSVFPVSIDRLELAG